MEEQDELSVLFDKVEQLIESNRLLKQENIQLKHAASESQSERERLLQHNELARKKVTEMIARLKAMEHEHG